MDTFTHDKVRPTLVAHHELFAGVGVVCSVFVAFSLLTNDKFCSVVRPDAWIVSGHF